MILFPAIDLKDGQCVRLKLGDMEQATVYNPDPGAQAKAFEDQGFEWLHVVDLNGAFAGESVNGAAVDAILKSTKNPVQLGGGIRTLDHIENWLSRGLSRVILGTVAVRDPALVIEACKNFPARSRRIDAKGGKVAVEGWAEASELGVIELAKKFEAPAFRRSSTRISTATAFWPASTGVHAGARRCRLHPRHRIGRACLARGYPPHAGAGCRAPRRCDFRPGAL